MRGLSLWFRPVAACFWICEVLKKVFDSTAVTGEWRHIPLCRGIEERGMSRQLGVGQTSMQVMDSVERLMQQRQGEELAGPGVGHDAAGRTPRGVAT